MEILLLAVLLARVGLAMYTAGLTRAKNSAGVVVRAVCDLGVAALAFYLLGAAIVSQRHNAIFAMSFGHWFDAGLSVSVLFFLLHAVVATGLALGPTGERSRFPAVLAVSAALAGVVVPLLAFWSYLGWFADLRLIDGAGGCWVHVAGGASAAIGAWLVGPRGNKYHRDGSASVIPGHSVPLAGLGAMLLFAGLAAMTAAVPSLTAPTREVARVVSGRAGLNAMLAGSAGIVASLAFGVLRYGKPDVLLVLTGMLGGVVAIAAGAAAVYPVWAILIGGVAGAIVPLAAVELDLRLRVDDPTNAVAIHLVGGAWGTVAAGVFSGRGVGGTFQAVGVQLLGVAVAAVLAGGVTFGVLKFMAPRVRASEADEFDGLDLAEHDIGAYPDFQQNSIRSYHLREA